MGVTLGASSIQVAASFVSIKDVDHKRTIIMLQKNLDELIQEKDKQKNETLEQASILSRDLCEDRQLGSEEKAPIRHGKVTRV
jgi:hypothetical protein